jgi:segregation and condensation protein B
VTEQQDNSADVYDTPAVSATQEALESVRDAERVVVPDASSAAEQPMPTGGDQAEPAQPELPVESEVVIDDGTMRRALEAILMVTDEPLPVLTLARSVGRPTGDVATALTSLSEEYTEQGRGFDLREVAGGWRYYTRDDAAPYVERFVLDGQQSRLTQAALETLAVVAYKQPVSRARVSAVRGVNVDGVMRTLVSRGLVEEAGADTESHATLYRTTSYFLERMGMQSLDDLPELAPYLPEMDDMEEELAAHAAPPPDPEVAASGTESPEAGEVPEVGDVSGAGEGLGVAGDSEVPDQLKPAEELEAVREAEIEQTLNPAEALELAPEHKADQEPRAAEVPRAAEDLQAADERGTAEDPGTAEVSRAAEDPGAAEVSRAAEDPGAAEGTGAAGDLQAAEGLKAATPDSAAATEPAAELDAEAQPAPPVSPDAEEEPGLDHAGAAAFAEPEAADRLQPAEDLEAAVHDVTVEADEPRPAEPTDQPAPEPYAD